MLVRENEPNNKGKKLIIPKKHPKTAKGNYCNWAVNLASRFLVDNKERKAACSIYFSLCHKWKSICLSEDYTFLQSGE